MISVTDIENVRDVFKIFYDRVCNNFCVGYNLLCTGCEFANEYYNKCELKESYDILTELLKNMKNEMEEED